MTKTTAFRQVTWPLGAAAAVAILVGAGGARAAGGALDPAFGQAGKVLTNLAGDDWANAVAIQPDGGIVAAGAAGPEYSPDFALARYTTRGRLDTSFGRGGKALTDLGSKSRSGANAVAIQADGKIVAAGHRAKGSDDFALVRYTRGGVLDGSFGSGGFVLTDLTLKSRDWARSVAVQADGKIIAAGYSRGKGRPWDSYDFALARYTK